MARLQQAEFDALTEPDWYWHDERRDREGVRIKKGDDLSCIGDPTVLYAEDFNIPKTTPAWEGEQEVEFALDDLSKTCQNLKDRDLAKSLEEQGGTSMVLHDSARTFVVLLWIGKTEEEVAKPILATKVAGQCAAARDSLKSSVSVLVENLGEEQTRKIFEQDLAAARTPGDAARTDARR